MAPPSPPLGRGGLRGISWRNKVYGRRSQPLAPGEGGARARRTRAPRGVSSPIYTSNTGFGSTERKNIYKK